MRLLCLVIFVLVCYALASDNWFPHSTHLHAEYTMNCSLNVSMVNNKINWYLPTGELIESGKKYVLYKRSLRINDVTADDAGVYTCTVEGMVESFNEKHTLNMAGPMYYTMTDKYYWNILVGVVAGVGAGLIVIALVLIYTFRYRDPKLSRLQNEYDDDENEMCNTHL